MGWCSIARKARVQREGIKSTQSSRACKLSCFRTMIYEVYICFLQWYQQANEQYRSGPSDHRWRIPVYAPLLRLSIFTLIIIQSYRITDAEAVSMSRYLVKHDGLFLGSSSACNLVACVKLIRRMGWAEGQTIVTILWAWMQLFLRSVH